MARPRVGVYYFNEHYYVIPVGLAAYGHIEMFEKAVKIPLGSSSEVKAKTILDAFALFGETIPGQKYDNEEFKQKTIPFIKLTNTKSWSDFVRKTLRFGVYYENGNYEFSPDQYDRGGFTGIDGKEFWVSDTSLTDIGDAVDKARLLCIGKNS